MKIFNFAHWLASDINASREIPDQAKEQEEARLIAAYGEIPEEVLDHLYLSFCEVYPGNDLNECFTHNAMRAAILEIFKRHALAHERKPTEEAEVIYDARVD